MGTIFSAYNNGPLTYLAGPCIIMLLLADCFLQEGVRLSLDSGGAFVGLESAREWRQSAVPEHDHSARNGHLFCGRPDDLSARSHSHQCQSNPTASSESSAPFRCAKCIRFVLL